MLDAYEVEPASMADVLAERPLVVFGKWRGGLGGSVRVKGTRANGEAFEQVIPVGAADGDATENPALRLLWARHRIAALGDDRAFGGKEEETKRAITNLGLTYGLLTEFTSFVAVDETPRDMEADVAKTVKQPLPLPQGVTNQATLLFVKESGMAEMPDWAHEGIGLAVFALVCGVVARGNGVSWRMRRPRGRWIAAGGVAAALLLVPLWPERRPAGEAFPGWPTRFEGLPLTEVPLEPEDARFAEGFQVMLGKSEGAWWAFTVLE